MPIPPEKMKILYFNKLGAAVDTILNEGYSQSLIMHKLNVKRQRVNYWESHNLKIEQGKKTSGAIF